MDSTSGGEHEGSDDSPDSGNEILRQFTAIVLFNESSNAPVADRADLNPSIIRPHRTVSHDEGGVATRCSPDALVLSCRAPQAIICQEDDRSGDAPVPGGPGQLHPRLAQDAAPHPAERDHYVAERPVIHVHQ